MLDHTYRTRSSVLEEETPFLEPLETLEHTTTEPGATVVPQRRLAMAMAAWMSATFLLCYLLLPAVMEASGAYTGLLGHFVDDVRAFLITAGIAVAGVMTLRPRVTLHRLADKATADPILAATSGSLLTWGILHNTLPWLTPLVSMPPAELAPFLALNVVECSLFGAMLASLVRSRIAAFLLGATFELTFLASASWFYLT